MLGEVKSHLAQGEDVRTLPKFKDYEDALIECYPGVIAISDQYQKSKIRL